MIVQSTRAATMTAFMSVLTILLTFSSVSQAGGESGGGGGSPDRAMFYAPVHSALDSLLKIATSRASQDEGEMEYVGQLLYALRKTILVPVHGNLRDRHGVTVPFYNDPDKFEIHYNVEAWQKLSPLLKAQFGIHELLGLLRIEDPFYSESTKLAELALGKSPAQVQGPAPAQLPVCQIEYGGDSANVRIHDEMIADFDGLFLDNRVRALDFIKKLQSSGECAGITEYHYHRSQ